jgi:hypothetical protein
MSKKLASDIHQEEAEELLQAPQLTGILAVLCLWYMLWYGVVCFPVHAIVKP